MKKTIVVLLIVVLFSWILVACGADKDKIQSDFSNMIENAATPEDIQSTAEFLDENIPLVGEEKASDMLAAYEHHLLNYISENTDKTSIEALRTYFDFDKGVIDEQKIEGSEMKAFYDKIKAGSLMVVCYENAMILKVDYAKLLEKYGDYISESIQSLYGLVAETTAKPTTENATLMIHWEDLLDRTFAAETLLKNYPEDDLVKDDAMWLYTTHLNTLLMGTTNTPIFDYSSKEFSSEARDAYEAFVIANPDTTLTWVLKEYFTYLNGIDFSLDFKDSTMSKVFFDTCDWLVSEAEKRVMQ